MRENLFNHSSYQEKFREKVGAGLGIGQYGQYKGRLIPFLSAEAHRERVERYLRLGRHYGALLEEGETIEDSVPAQLRALETELLIEQSLFLPFPRI